MTIKEQWENVKNNWLIVLGFIVIVLILSNFNIHSFNAIGENFYADNSLATKDMGVAGNLVPYPEDFAPGVELRNVVYNGNVGVKVDRGSFESVERNLEEIVNDNGAVILDRNVNVVGSGFSERHVGYYNVRIDASKIDEFMLELKGLGKATEFSKNAIDITGNYLSLEEQLDLEKSKLMRFESLLSQASIVEDKVSLISKISEQERIVYYLEDALKNNDERIDYASVSFSVEEKTSYFGNFSIIGLGELIRSFLESLSNMVKFIFVVLPWAIVVGIVWFVVKKIGKK